MSQLAIDGGKPAVKLIRKSEGIGKTERDLVNQVLKSGNLSGYLAGRRASGPFVQAVEEKAADMLGFRHCIACNSATSGLLAATAIWVPPSITVHIASLSMSATAAPAFILGRRIKWLDVDRHGCADDDCYTAIVTDLFGEPARRSKCSIVDAAQSFLAKDIDGAHAPIEVYSLNVHKVIQCGEGGLICTDDDYIADNCRHFINHGEVSGEPPGLAGLNLRMTELTAAVALGQLDKARSGINRLRHLDTALRAAIPEFFRPWPHREGTVPTPYCLAMTCQTSAIADFAAHALCAEGISVQHGYGSGPLYRLPAFDQNDGTYCPIAEDLHARSIIMELVPIDPTDAQLRDIINAFTKVAEAW